ncbi:MAG TPA: Ig-like domain-containing protein [Gemmatimonadaceae bacterium]|nr:Ig-like domain-containing protein [Gemmatimonadaceae bacterium]
MKRLLSVLFLAAPLAAQEPNASAMRIVVTPANPVVTAGDTLRLNAHVVDAAGKTMEGVKVRFQQQGARFEAFVDSSGLVVGGVTGTVPVALSAIVPGERPLIRRVDVKIVPGPAAIVEPTPNAARLAVGQRMRFGATVKSKSADVRTGDAVTWRSSAPNVVRVDNDGMATAVAAGRATLTATSGSASGTVNVQVMNASVAAFEISPARIDARQGDVIRFKTTARDASGRAIDGLSVNWSFSPGQGAIEQDGAFVGYEVGDYVVTASLGSRTAQAVVRLTDREVRRPLTVVGRLPRTRFSTEEVWIHPNGKNAYLGSGGGGDVLYALDISNPAKPIVTDSLVLNTRRVNDVMSDPDGKFIIFTREGAADRKNGVVIASLEDPAHPKVISEFTDGVTSGVHSAFIYKDPKYGTHAYITNDGTGALHVLNLDNPAQPKEVAQWRTPKAFGDVGRTLHDIDVQNGLLYGSWWNDGLVVLDVGNGIKGGTPSNPQFVSQYKYDLNALYKDVEQAAGPGFIRGTHTAWRHKNYVFIADEVFPARGVQGAKDASAGRAYGRLQVIDVSDLEKPRSVAFYEPEFGGVHNVWVAGDTLYMGAYNAGFRVFDISGELRGDLRAQNREIGHINTADMDGRVQNAAMAWGVVVKDGLAYVNDMYNGLWIVRIEPKTQVIP